MIHATEALKLPTAQLNDADKAAVDEYEKVIEQHILKSMERRGCELKLDLSEKDANVIAELNQRVKMAGYNPKWQQLVEQHPLNKAVTKTLGFLLFICPSDESYESKSTS